MAEPPLDEQNVDLADLDTEEAPANWRPEVEDVEFHVPDRDEDADA